MKTMIVVGTAILSLAGLPAAKTRHDAPRPDSDHAAHFLACAKVCAECEMHCQMNFQHCAKLVASGQKDHERSMHTSLDCGELCAVAGKLSARHSEFAVPACDACAKACETCAGECEKHASDQHMQECAKACRDCAKACREMVQHVSAGK